jgi:TonB family protein
MRVPDLFCLLLLAPAPLFAQTTPNPLPPLPKDPKAMLAAAAQLYDFNDPTLIPWHLKGSYQLYQENGTPGEQGAYEYWWIAPNVYRSTWSRPSATRTEWHTADGKSVYQATGERLLYFEQDIEAQLFSTIPKLDTPDTWFEKDLFAAQKVKLPCAVIRMRIPFYDDRHSVPGTFTQDSYCFEPTVPALRIKRTSNSAYVAFDRLAQVQNRILPGSITIALDAHKLLSFTLNATDSLAKNDAALTPPTDALPFSSRQSSTFGKRSTLAQKAPPIYPQAAKDKGIQGTVLLDVMIGTDGKVNDIRVLSSPSPLLSNSSKDCVAKWQYAPYIVDGHPQEVHTLITVIFQLS